MNINELTIGEAKELANLFCSTTPAEKHLLDGQKVVAILPNGFIHFGVLHDKGGRYSLTEASNLRYWKTRTGGLPEFAESGPISDDKIDKIGTVHLESVVFFYPAGDWS